MGSRRPRCLQGVMCAFLAVVARGQAQDSIDWQGDFAAAVAKAKAEGRPLFVAFIMDGEAANDETVRKHYKDPSIVELSRRMVCVVGNTGEHGGEGGPCPKFGSITCAQHRAIEIAARQRFLKTEVARAPQHVFCNADGVEVLRKVYLIPIAELRKSMKIALGRASAGAQANDAIAEERARVDQLLEQAGSRNAETRDAAFSGLAAADDERAIPALLDKVKVGNKGVRYAAIKALGIKGNYPAIAPLLGLLRGSDAKMITAAAEALEKIKLPDPVPELLVLLEKDRRDRVRGRVLRAIASCYPESEAVQKACLGAMQRASRQIVDSALIALFDLAPHPDVVKAVLPHLKSKNQNTRALAIWVLGKQRDAAQLGALRALAAGDSAPEVRELAQKAADFCAGKDVAEYESLYTSFHWDEDF